MGGLGFMLLPACYEVRANSSSSSMTMVIGFL